MLVRLFAATCVLLFAAPSLAEHCAFEAQRGCVLQARDCESGANRCLDGLMTCVAAADCLVPARGQMRFRNEATTGLLRTITNLMARVGDLELGRRR